MFNKKKKKESESLLEEVDDMYLGESAGISKVGSAIISSAYVQPDMYATLNPGYDNKVSMSGLCDKKGRIF